MGKTILLSALGKGNYSKRDYEYHDRTYTTSYAPVATAALAFEPEERADLSVRLLSTTEAKEKHFGGIQQAFRDLNIEDVEFREVPEGADLQGTSTILRTLVDVVPPDETASVAADVSLGFRHLPLLYVAALAYLVGLTGIRVRGIYYGAADLVPPPEACPILDLTRVFEFLQWYQALAALSETGRAQGLAKVLRHHVRNLFVSSPGTPTPSRTLSSLRDAAESLATPLACGLPLESGMAATKLLALLGRAAQEAPDEGLFAGQKLAGIVQSWALDAAVENKRNVALTEGELRRQWAFIRWCFEHNDFANCFEALREWVVNLVLWRQGRTANWLDYDSQRKPAERLLNALSYRVRNNFGQCTATQRALASTWDKISEKRNLLAHAGMKATEVKVAPQPVAALLQEAEELLTSVTEMDVRLVGTRTVLVAALGRSPGALFTALHHVRPQMLIVLTSQESVARLEATLAAADATTIETLPVVLEDPYRAFRQAERVIEQCRPSLLVASRLVVNLTGGTTAMQYLAERVADEAKRLGTPVQRVAVLDERPQAAQQADPFQLGAIEWIDGPPESHGSNSSA
ncbi:MAG: TM1812 family CRISPR-associated protein [Candidatus Binatia bacterium]|nr:TM1812 family CRISPR-associated protein [Candidatus Binatia bacterium]